MPGGDPENRAAPRAEVHFLPDVDRNLRLRRPHVLPRDVVAAVRADRPRASPAVPARRSRRGLSRTLRPRLRFRAFHEAAILSTPPLRRHAYHGLKLEAWSLKLLSFIARHGKLTLWPSAISWVSTSAPASRPTRWRTAIG